jgi:hypothetical protein
MASGACAGGAWRRFVKEMEAFLDGVGSGEFLRGAIRLGDVAGRMEHKGFVENELGGSAEWIGCRRLDSRKRLAERVESLGGKTRGV